MNCKIAIFDLKGALAPEDQPLMLEPVLFCPVLTWMAQELMCCGVQRYFIVCRENWREEAREALQGFDAEFFDDVPAALSAAEEDVMVVPGPVVPVYGPEDRNVYTADAAVLRSRLREGTSLTDCPAEAVGVRALWQPREQAPAFRAFSSAAELNAAMPAARELLMRRMASNGVTVVDPVNTYVDPRCSVAPGVTLLPGTILRGHTAIAAGCEIGPNSMVRDCIVGEGTTVNASQVNESTIGSHTTVGPFTYVRPGCRIGDHCRVGDFVEVKNSVIGDGTKISHLTYVGDSDVGRRVNFGCGTVTTNYDGHKKFRCTMATTHSWAAIPTSSRPSPWGTGPIPPPGPPLPTTCPTEPWPLPGPGRPTRRAGPTGCGPCGKRTSEYRRQPSQIHQYQERFFD